MKLDEQQLRTIDHLVKMAAYDNAHNIQHLEDMHKDFVALHNSDVYQERLARKEHLEELSCIIAGELMGVVVEIKLKRNQS